MTTKEGGILARSEEKVTWTIQTYKGNQYWKHPEIFRRAPHVAAGGTVWWAKDFPPNATLTIVSVAAVTVPPPTGGPLPRRS